MKGGLRYCLLALGLSSSRIVPLTWRYRCVMIIVMSETLLSTNHRIIGLLYAWFSLIFSHLSFGLSLSLRLESSVIGSSITMGSGQVYNVLISSHGVMMVFLFIMPASLGAIANFYVPLCQLLLDFGYPRINNFGLQLVPFCGMLMSQGASQEEGCGFGWTLYPPLCLKQYHASLGTDSFVLSLHGLGLGSTLSSINILLSAMCLVMLPLDLACSNILVLAMMITSLLIVVSMPVLAVALTFILTDRNLNTSFLDASCGGDAIVFQHLFWFFGHPEVYIIILPFFGVVSFSIMLASGLALVGNNNIAFALMVLSSLSFIVWAHHMLIVGLDNETRSYFSLASMLIAVPTSIKINSWSSSMLNIHSSNTETSLCGSFLLTFSLGGCSGLILANPLLDTSLHDTFFVVAHFHFTLSLGAVFGLALSTYAFIHIVSSKDGRNNLKLNISYTMVLGANLTFSSLHLVGTQGYARRMPECSDLFASTTLCITLGMIVLWLFVTETTMTVAILI